MQFSVYSGIAAMAKEIDAGIAIRRQKTPRNTVRLVHENAILSCIKPNQSCRETKNNRRGFEIAKSMEMVFLIEWIWPQRSSFNDKLRMGPVTHKTNFRINGEDGVTQNVEFWI